ncbi:hypothetical protein C9374_002479 [Naegleria lovaniensis]|uniref:UDENN domain-containing protein n=1 Tax=Naegleria lovaniensis TaxID=51637 RepID=A0AA88GPV6_NAELO|nr:uncharacterized protein C9374_002479 [Naegleria lovaniensis]KAG2386735.1 hypothetical protein C9374_002479 [Naegleria lovaniensis]
MNNNTVPPLRFLSTVSVFVLKKESDDENNENNQSSRMNRGVITSPSSPVMRIGGNSLFDSLESPSSHDGRNGNAKFTTTSSNGSLMTHHRKNINTYKEYAMMRGQNKDSFNAKKYTPPKTDLIFTHPKDLSNDKTVTINSMPLFCFYAHHHERNLSEYISRNTKIRLASVGSSHNVQLFPFVMTDYFKNECYCFCILVDNATYNENVAIVFETSIPIYEMMSDIILEMYQFGLFQVFLDAHFRDQEMRNHGESSKINFGRNDSNYQNLLEKKNLLLTRIEMMIHHIPIPPPSKNIYTSFTLLQKNYVLKYPDVEELPFCNIPISETIFKTLSNDMIVDLLNLILLEKKIIFVSESVSLLTYCCESLRALLYPFQFPLMFAFIPHLPVQLLETILSPVPYIAGVHNSLKNELFMVIDQQNRMLEQTSHTNTTRIKSPSSSSSDRAYSPSENDTSLVVLDIDSSTFLYGKAPEREQRFPERYRLQLIEKLEPILRSASKSIDFLSGPISKREERISIDTKIRELFTWFYCKLLIPLNIHILTRKWKKNNKRNGTEYIDSIKRYVLEEASEEIDSNQRAFFSHLFSNQIFSELLNHGVEEQYFYQELCFSIFVNSEAENLMKNRNHVIPFAASEKDLVNWKNSNNDTSFNLNSVQEWFSKGQSPNDVLIYWINSKLEALKSQTPSTQLLLTSNYNISRLMLMRSFVHERAERFEQALEDALTAMSTATDERLVRREWFESLLLRIPKQSLMKFVAKMKTKYSPRADDLFKLGFLEKIVLDMHQGHIQDVKALFQQAELFEPGSSFELRPRRKSVPNSSVSPVDSNPESELHTADSLDEKQLVTTSYESQEIPRANSFPSGNPIQLPTAEDEEDRHFDSPPMSPRSPTISHEDDLDEDVESLEALQTPLTSKKRSFSSTSIHEYSDGKSPTASSRSATTAATTVLPTTKATKSSSGTILLSLPFINFASIEHQLIPKNMDALTQLSSMNATTRRRSILFTKKKSSELDTLSKMVSISKEMFSMVAFECGMFFSKQDGDRIYDQLVLIQKDTTVPSYSQTQLHHGDDASSLSTLKPETLKKFLNWFKIVNQLNQYSTLRFRKIESPQTVAVSSYEQQQHNNNNESIVILTQSTLCEATFSYATVEGKEFSQESSIHNGRICFCNDGSIYFGISKLELVVSDMSQIIKIDHYPPQSMLKQQPDLLNLKIEGSVKIVVRVDFNTTRHVEFKFPNTIQSLIWYGHFLSLMNFSTSITMSMIMSKKSHHSYVPTNPTTVSIFRSITIDHVLYLMKQARSTKD